jgi:FkbM family methyltransferase
MRFLKIFKSLSRIPEILRCRATTPEWAKLTASYIGLPVALPLDVPLRTGTFRLTTVADVRTFWLVFFAGTYDVRPSDRFIVDAGANIGTFTLYALLHAPDARVVAIEPAPDTCARLRKLIEDHGLTSRCTIHQAALGVVEGATTMDLAPESQFRSTGVGTTEVKVITLDSVIQGSETDLLKMDIEGAEYALLTPEPPECMKHVSRIDMEYHPNGKPDQLTAALQRAGLKCLQMRDDGLGYGLTRFERYD